MEYLLLLYFKDKTNCSFFISLKIENFPISKKEYLLLPKFKERILFGPQFKDRIPVFPPQLLVVHPCTHPCHIWIPGFKTHQQK